jgi:uncharacterized protein YndB with AHSA1/START domain
MLGKISLIVVALLGLVALMALIGALLPKAHVARRRVPLHRSPEQVWALISDIDLYASWRPDLKRVVRLPEVEGRPCWREETRRGAITFERIDASPPARLVTRIADRTLPFGGTWTYAVDAAPDGSTLTITEEGEVYNPIFRFLSRFVFGHTATIDAYLKAVGRKLGENPSLEDA